MPPKLTVRVDCVKYSEGWLLEHFDRAERFERQRDEQLHRGRHSPQIASLIRELAALKAPWAGLKDLSLK